MKIIRIIFLVVNFLVGMQLTCAQDNEAKKSPSITSEDSLKVLIIKDILQKSGFEVHFADHLFTLDTLSKKLDEVPLICLSLVSQDLYAHWEEQLPIFKEKYENSDFVLAVSTQDSQQRSEFILEFYNIYPKNQDIEKAFSKALKIIKARYGENLEFKHYFHQRN